MGRGSLPEEKKKLRDFPEATDGRRGLVGGHDGSQGACQGNEEAYKFSRREMGVAGVAGVVHEEMMGPRCCGSFLGVNAGSQGLCRRQ